MGTSVLFFGLWFIDCSRLAGAFGVTKKAMADRLGVGGPPLFFVPVGPGAAEPQPHWNWILKESAEQQRNDVPADYADKRGLEFRNAVAEFGEVELGAPDFRDGVAQISGREKS